MLLEDLVVEVVEARMLLQAKHNLDSNARGTRMTHLIECLVLTLRQSEPPAP